MVRYSDSLDLGCGYICAFEGLFQIAKWQAAGFQTATPELGVHVLLMSSSPNLVASGANMNKLAAVPFSYEVT